MYNWFFSFSFPYLHFDSRSPSFSFLFSFCQTFWKQNILSSFSFAQLIFQIKRRSLITLTSVKLKNCLLFCSTLSFSVSQFLILDFCFDSQLSCSLSGFQSLILLFCKSNFQLNVAAATAAASTASKVKSAIKEEEEEEEKESGNLRVSGIQKECLFSFLWRWWWFVFSIVFDS